MRPEVIPGVATDSRARRANLASARSMHAGRLSVAGIVVALLMAELALRPLTTALDNEWNPLTAELADTEVHEVRRFTEGIATSHFSGTRARLTGNPPIVGGPTGLILGDSYVEAAQIRDQETMGSVLERALRATGDGMNVRQYGWPGVDVPQYVSVARDLLHLWRPAWVVVVLTANDLGPAISNQLAQPVNDPNRHSGAGGDVRQGPGGWPHRLARAILGHSALVYHLLKRAQEAGLPLTRSNAPSETGPASLQPGGLPLPQRARIALQALHDSFGDRLRILFIADVGVDGRRERSPAERAVLAACDTLRLRCADTRALMTRDRHDSLRVSRGFMNSVPGAGHINAVGHALAAETIRRELLTPVQALSTPETEN